MKKKIIIDTDPAMGTKGGDPEDCFAIMLAINSPELDILGITTVQGNVPVERGFSNAKYLVEQLNKDIPVHTGTPGTYDKTRNEKRKWLGERKEMEHITPMLSIEDDKKGAPAFIVETAEKNSGDLELVTIGPLTNIAQALDLDAQLSTHVNKITMMAGASRFREMLHQLQSLMFGLIQNQRQEFLVPEFQSEWFLLMCVTRLALEEST